MFLHDLTGEEKNAFLELAHYIARSDDDFSEAEENMIATYCLEMQIKNIDYDENTFNLETTLSKFENKKSKKIALLEIMALIYSDGLEDEEQKILDKMVEVFDLTQELSTTYAKWTQSILKVSAQGYELIYS